MTQSRTLLEERRKIVAASIDQLKAKLGEAAFQKLDHYVRATVQTGGGYGVAAALGPQPVSATGGVPVGIRAPATTVTPEQLLDKLKQMQQQQQDQRTAKPPQ